MAKDHWNLSTGQQQQKINTAKYNKKQKTMYRKNLQVTPVSIIYEIVIYSILNNK